jgi:DnaJ-class molecular chaperone
MTPTDPSASAADAGAKCETCRGTGFVRKMGGLMPGERDDKAVEACPTCDGSGLNDPLSHRFPTAH